jgi:hypothetical protein
MVIENHTHAHTGKEFASFPNVRVLSIEFKKITHRDFTGPISFGKKGMELL